MDVSQKCKEVGIVIDGLTAKPILKNGTHMLILLIIMPSISHSKAFHHRGESFLLLLYKEMDVVGHQTIGKDDAVRWQRPMAFVFRMRQPSQRFEEGLIVVDIIENVLTVYSSEHHMIDARST